MDKSVLQIKLGNAYKGGINDLTKGLLESAREKFINAKNYTLELLAISFLSERTTYEKKYEEIDEFIRNINSAIETKRKECLKDKKVTVEDENKESENDNTFVSYEDKIDLRLKDICGQETVKELFEKRITRPAQFPEVYAKFKRTPSGSILMYGVPGTGKTMIARALAGELGATFYPISCSNIVSKYFGESENNIRKLFESARKQQRALIFFDEFDALSESRDQANNQSSRLIAEILIQLQGIQSDNNNVIVLAATNRPWAIDSAFLRPGRFTHRINIQLPDASTRQQIVEHEFEEVECSKKFSVSKIVQATEMYSPADVVEVCNSIKDFAIVRYIRTKEKFYVTDDDVNQALSSSKSSVQASDLALIEKYSSQSLSIDK